MEYLLTDMWRRHKDKEEKHCKEGTGRRTGL
jgi:hypothetical protein